jgi:hypothetical protein
MERARAAVRAVFESLKGPTARPEPRRHLPNRKQAPKQAGLPPVSAGEVGAILADAEHAAIREVLGGEPGQNPHHCGSRHHIIWEAHYGVTKLDWQGSQL